jgi:hypothetical protein
LVKPDAHDTEHVPPEQSWPLAHDVPQRPQLPLSVARSRHVPEHAV